MYSIKEVSKISGVSIRTLHHYDEIGLLVSKKKENNYRIYSDNDIDRLQKVLFYKVLGFKLKDINVLLEKDSSDRLETLLKQQELLKKEKEQLEMLLITIEKTIRDYKGEEKMTVEEKFDGFSKEYFDMYETEAKQKYGEKSVENAKTNIYDNPEVLEKWISVFKTVAAYISDAIAYYVS